MSKKHIKPTNLSPNNNCASHAFFGINFSVALDTNELNITKTIYKKQCLSLVSLEDQKSLFRILTIGRLNHIPLLSLLVDTYTRDRISYYFKKKQPLTVDTWAKKFVRRVSRSNNTIKYVKQDISMSVELFFTRYCGKLQFDYLHKICDRPFKFANYALSGVFFVNRLLDQDSVTPPFQIDIAILPAKVKQTVLDNVVISSDDEPDEENDVNDKKIDDGDTYDDDGPEFMKHLSASLKDRFDANKCFYDYKEIEQELNGAYSHPNRLLYQFYSKKFQSEMIKKYNDDMNDDMSDLKYPHNKRFCIAIDIDCKNDDGFDEKNNGNKGKSGGINSKKELDGMFMFEPSVNNAFPSGYVYEWSMEALFHSIIPALPNNKSNDNNSNDIAGNTAGNGYVFVLSFQVHSKDAIRCYCCYGSKMFRFLPNDILNIWSFMFCDENQVKSNKKNKELLTQIVKQMESLTKTWDPMFDRFYHKTSVVL